MKLLYLQSEKKNQEISLYVNSPGGYVSSTLAIYDTMQFLDAPVATYAIGLAASGAALLLAGGKAGRRFALPHAKVMLHQPAGEVGGQAADIEIAAKEVLKDKETLIKIFAKQYSVKFPKAVAKVVDDEDVLLAFYDYPAEHWIHLRTTNPIESTFATVRLRTKVTRGSGSRSAALAMTFKLIESAQERWRAVNAPHQVALVRAGARFDKGVLVEREEVTAA